MATFSDLIIYSDVLSRKFSVIPSKKLAFFLGAGASASSHILTAFEMTEDFKRRLYASEKGIKITTIEQRYYDFKKDIDNWIKIKFKEVPDNEYAFFFEQAFPSRKDRTDYIRKALESAKPSIGYEVIRFLIEKGIIWHFITTNFDNLIQKVYPDLIEITEENIKTHGQKININPEYPIVIKLHGDFRYDWLRNTDTETQMLCSSVLESLKGLFKYLGLIVIGYSGRDESVMSFIEEFVREEDKPFPYGFYWCIKDDSNCNLRVKTLIENLRKKGTEAYFVKITSFDDLLIEIYKQLSGNDNKIDEWLSNNRVLRPFRISHKSNDNKFIVLNCMRIVEYPRTFVVFKYKNIQNWKDLEKLTKNKPIIASFFRGKNIIALGEESQIIEVFKDYIGGDIEYYTITENDLSELNKQRGFIYGIYYKIFEWYFLNLLALKKVDKRIFYKEQIHVKNIPRYSKKIQYFKAFNYSIEFRDKKMLFIITPYYITANFERINRDIYKIQQNFLISNMWNQDVLKDLIYWQKILIRNGGKFIKIEFPSGVLRFLIQSKFYKCGKAL